MSEPLLVECARCETVVKADPFGEFEAYEPELGPPEKYTFMACRNCRSPIVTGQEHYGVNPDGEEVWSDLYRVFPAPDDAWKAGIPTVVQNPLREARRCFKAKAYTAAALMCRRTLEAICVDHSVRERTLNASLAKLKADGLIEGLLFEWSDALRLAGNAAAHDVANDVSREDASDVLEFTTALLEYLYTFRHKFDAFRARRAGGTNASA